MLRAQIRFLNGGRFVWGKEKNVELLLIPANLSSQPGRKQAWQEESFLQVPKRCRTPSRSLHDPLASEQPVLPYPISCPKHERNGRRMPRCVRELCSCSAFPVKVQPVKCTPVE